MKTLKIGLIGLGYWGPHFARTIFDKENIVLDYCCDLDKVRLAKIGQRYPSVKLISDYNEMLKDKSVDAVIVVTPPGTHHRIVKDVLLAGKDVLVEKPMTLNSQDAQDLIKIAEKNKRILMVDHIFQFNPAISKLKEILDKKELGDIFYISGSYTALGPVRVDVNSMWDLAPHFFYTLSYLLGQKPIWVKALGGSYLKDKTEDVAFITLGFPGNVLANIHVSWLYPYKVRHLVVVGSKKMAVFDDVTVDQKVRIYDKGAEYDKTNPEYPEMLKVTYREGDLLIPKIEAKEPLFEVLSTFEEAVRSRKLSKSGGREGKEVVEILEAADKSLSRNGELVKI